MRRSLCLLILLVGMLGQSLTVVSAPEERGPDFQKEILPILEDKCLRCHGGKRRDGKLDLSTRETMLKGGASGAAFVPGDPDKSLMIELIHFNEMPPKRAKPRVSEAELKLLKKWIHSEPAEKATKP